MHWLRDLKSFINSQPLFLLIWIMDVMKGARIRMIKELKADLIDIRKAEH